jgi:hypothetical protein
MSVPFGKLCFLAAQRVKTLEVQLEVKTQNHAEVRSEVKIRSPAEVPNGPAWDNPIWCKIQSGN